MWESHTHASARTQCIQRVMSLETHLKDTNECFCVHSRALGAVEPVLKGHQRHRQLDLSMCASCVHSRQHAALPHMSVRKQKRRIIYSHFHLALTMFCAPDSTSCIVSNQSRAGTLAYNNTSTRGRCHQIFHISQFTPRLAGTGIYFL